MVDVKQAGCLPDRPNSRFLSLSCVFAMNPRRARGTPDDRADTYIMSLHTHYQFVSSTPYPETRKKLAAIHQQRAMLEQLSAPGWAIMSTEHRQEIMTKVYGSPSSSEAALPSPPKMMEASSSSISFAHDSQQ